MIKLMFSCNEAPAFVGLGVEDPGLQDLLHKVGVINEGQKLNLPFNEIRHLNLYLGRFSL